MDIAMDDVDKDTVNNLEAADSNMTIGANNANIDLTLQQLLAATTSLQESVKNIDNTINEVKSQQHDMRSNIDQLEKAVFNTDIHGTRSNKQRHGHALEVLNEEGILNGGSDNDDGSDTNSSTHDDGNITNNNTTLDDGNDAVKPVEFDAEGYTFLNNDVNNDGKVNNDDVHENVDNDKALDTLHVSFGAVNHINGTDSSIQLYYQFHYCN